MANAQQNQSQQMNQNQGSKGGIPAPPNAAAPPVGAADGDIDAVKGSVAPPSVPAPALNGKEGSKTNTNADATKTDGEEGVQKTGADVAQQPSVADSSKTAATGAGT